MLPAIVGYKRSKPIKRSFPTRFRIRLPRSDWSSILAGLRASLAFLLRLATSIQFLSILSLLIVRNFRMISTFPSYPMIKSRAGSLVMHKIVNGECGEIVVDADIAPYMSVFAGMKDGSCKNNGYTNYSRSIQRRMGPFGRAQVSIYQEEAAEDD